MKTNIKSIVLLAISFIMICGCTKERVHTDLTAIRNIGKLAVYKVQNADLLTGKDDDVEVKYIAYTDAMICVDFSNVSIKLVDEKSRKYEVRFPEFTVEQARVIHDKKYSRPWSAKAKRGTSTTKVDSKLKIAAQRAIATEARKPEHMSRALEQAKAIVETMIHAGDKEAVFIYP